MEIWNSTPPRIVAARQEPESGNCSAIDAHVNLNFFHLRQIERIVHSHGATFVLNVSTDGSFLKQWFQRIPNDNSI